MQALSNGVICKRVKPTHWYGTRFLIPEKYQKRKDLNQWVEVVSVGNHVMEDLKAGDKVCIGENTGTPFSHLGEDYVLIYGSKFDFDNRGKKIPGYGTDVFVRDRE
jgi:co-chaperonin GroES (HSP10)